MKTLRDKIAVVTGAASGIGRATAIRLAGEGTHLDLWDVNTEGLAETAGMLVETGVRVRTRVLDLTENAAIDQAVEDVLADWGHIDLLVNNAGICYYGPTDRMTDEQWDRIMAVNLLAPIRISRRFLPVLLDRPDGHLLNVCSISGLVASGRINTYHTTKFGLVGFTLALRAEYGRQGLGVTALCPGPVRTNLYNAMMNGRGPGKDVPHPPKILSATEDAIANRIVRAVKWNQRMPLITPIAHLIFQVNRFAPWLVDRLNLLGRRKRLRKKARLATDRAAIGSDTETEVKRAA